MENTVRVGYISSIDYQTGMVRVAYPDKGNGATAELPFFNFTGEYRMPKVKEMVLVLHLSNDTSSGVVMGSFWGDGTPPPVSGDGEYQKTFSDTAYERVQNSEFVIHAKQIRFECNNGSISVAELIQMKAKLDSL